MDTPRLTRETRERIEAQHADAIRRVLAAEAATLGLLSTTVEEATQRLVAAVATAPDDELQTRRMVHLAVAQQSTRLQQEFGEAVRGGRRQARELARGQAELELGLIQAGMVSLGSGEPVPGVVEVDSTEVDEAQGQLASASMAAAWAAAALAVFSQWRAKRESPRQLPARLGRAGKLVHGRVRRHAATQALDAYNREHGRAFPVPTPKRGREARGPAAETHGQADAEVEEVETEQGLPFGWEALTYDVWSATLDHKTCAYCFDRDGRMTPVAKRGSVDWPIAHPNCRCVRVTVFVPEAARKKLPGLQIDYAELKKDIRDYFRGASLSSLKGRKHIEEYLQGTVASTSPETLTRKLRNRRGYVDPRSRAVLRPREEWRRLGRNLPREPAVPRLPGPVTGGGGQRGSGAAGGAPPAKLPPGPPPPPALPPGGASGGGPPRRPRHTVADFRSAGIEISGRTPAAAERHLEEIQRAARDLMGEELTPDGLRALVGAEGAVPGTSVSYRVSASEGALNYRAGILDSAGNEICPINRDWERHGDQVVVHHNIMWLDARYRDSGAGRQIIGNQIRQYLRLGVSAVETEAAAVGQYYWPKIGFALQNPDDLAELRLDFQTFLRSRGLGRWEARRVVEQIGSIHEIAVARVEGRALGKEFLLERGESRHPMIPLRLDLSEGSTGRRLVETEFGL